MADRTTKVRLVAEVQQYLAGMEKARKATSEMADDSSQKLAQQREAFQLLGGAALAVGAIAAAGAVLAVKKYADFDQAMSNVKAATQETAENMGLLREAALEAGADTVFSADQAANAIEELGKAGLSTEEILSGGLSGALDLAASGQLEVARAAEITAITLKQFNLDGGRATDIADLLAAGAGKAAGDVEDLAQALNQSALVARQTGLSVEETTGTLAAFASAGLLGSDAGTSFKTALQRLTPTSKEAEDEMKRLGISAFDASGEFIGISKFAGVLQTGLKDLTDEQRNASLSIIFGSDAVRAASVLYDEGAAGIQEWIDKTDDAGYSARVAADRLDNLSGDLEQLGGSIDTALIQTGSAANGALRILTQSATQAVNAFSDLDPAAQAVTLGLGGTLAAAGLVSGTIFTLIPKVAEFNAALEVMGPKAQAAGKAAVGLSKGLGLIAAATAAVTVLDQIAHSSDPAALGLEEVTRALLKGDLDKTFSEISSEVNDMDSALNALFGNDPATAFDRWGQEVFAFTGLTSELAQSKDAFDSVGASLAQLVSSGEGERASRLFKDVAEAAEEQGISTDQLLDLMPQYRDALAGVDNAQTLAAGSADDNVVALEGMTGAAGEAEESVKDLADAIRGFGNVQLDVNSANRAFEQAIDDLTESLGANGATLDISTQAGRDNQAALDDLARSTSDLAGSVYEQTGSQEAANEVLARGREAYVKAAIAAGMLEEEAIAYADALIATPTQVSTAVELSGVAQAQTRLDRFISTNANRSIRIGLDYAGDGIGNVARANGGIEEYANGGVREGIYQGRPGGIIKFAEPETGWEAFISGKPGQENRNRMIWQNAGERLGMFGGGMSSTTTQNIELRVESVDPMVVGEMVLQQIGARVRGAI